MVEISALSLKELSNNMNEFEYWFTIVMYAVFGILLCIITTVLYRILCCGLCLVKGAYSPIGCMCRCCRKKEEPLLPGDPITR